MMRMMAFRNRFFWFLFPANNVFTLDPVSAFSQFGEVDKQVSSLFHEEYGM